MYKNIEREDKEMVPHTEHDQRVGQNHLLLFQSETLLCPGAPLPHLKGKCFFYLLVQLSQSRQYRIFPNFWSIFLLKDLEITSNLVKVRSNSLMWDLTFDSNDPPLNWIFMIETIILQDLSSKNLPATYPQRTSASLQKGRN